MSNHSEHDCRVCGTDISGKRSDARYCSARCRMRDRRRQQKAELIAKLAGLYRRLPNHAARCQGAEVYLFEWESMSGKAGKWETFEPRNLSISKLKTMISRKRQLVIIGMFIKGAWKLFG